MFDQLKAMGAIAGLIKDKDRLRATVERFREKIARVSVTGEAGGGDRGGRRGGARVTVSGQLRVTEVFLDPALIAGLQAGESGRAVAQALIRDATNDALSRAQAIIQDEMNREARGLGLPAMPGLGAMMGLPD